MTNILVKDGVGAEKEISAFGDGTESNPFIPRSRTVGAASLDNLPLYQFADTVGDGSGSTNMGVDGSTTSAQFKVAPSAGTIYDIARVVVSIRDTGSFDSGGWGNNGGSPLPNGITASVTWNGTEVPLTEEPITSHIDLAAISYDVSYNDWGSGDPFIVFRFTFTKSGNTISLNGDDGDFLAFTVEDDLSYLVQQRVSVQGSRRDS